MSRELEEVEKEVRGVLTTVRELGVELDDSLDDASPKGRERVFNGRRYVALHDELHEWAIYRDLNADPRSEPPVIRDMGSKKAAWLALQWKLGVLQPPQSMSAAFQELLALNFRGLWLRKTGRLLLIGAGLASIGAFIAAYFAGSVEPVQSISMVYMPKASEVAVGAHSLDMAGEFGSVADDLYKILSGSFFRAIFLMSGLFMVLYGAAVARPARVFTGMAQVVFAMMAPALVSAVFGISPPADDTDFKRMRFEKADRPLQELVADYPAAEDPARLLVEAQWAVINKTAGYRQRFERLQEVQDQIRIPAPLMYALETQVLGHRVSKATLAMDREVQEKIGFRQSLRRIFGNIGLLLSLAGISALGIGALLKRRTARVAALMGMAKGLKDSSEESAQMILDAVSRRGGATGVTITDRRSGEPV